mmetsp:Transcript_7336/g.27587  ORF Transcript_7336/g.27587 Transcript_7336/m.27587 type:complete len:335 (+) Transcript_7336:4168-5172(+)
MVFTSSWPASPSRVPTAASASDLLVSAVISPPGRPPRYGESSLALSVLLCNALCVSSRRGSFNPAGLCVLRRPKPRPPSPKIGPAPSRDGRAAVAPNAPAWWAFEFESAVSRTESSTVERSPLPPPKLARIFPNSATIPSATPLGVVAPGPPEMFPEDEAFPYVWPVPAAGFPNEPWFCLSRVLSGCTPTPFGERKSSPPSNPATASASASRDAAFVSSDPMTDSPPRKSGKSADCLPVPAVMLSTGSRATFADTIVPPPPPPPVNTLASNQGTQSRISHVNTTVSFTANPDAGSVTSRTFANCKTWLVHVFVHTALSFQTVLLLFFWFTKPIR